MYLNGGAWVCSYVCRCSRCWRRRAWSARGGKAPPARERRLACVMTYGLWRSWTSRRSTCSIPGPMCCCVAMELCPGMHPDGAHAATSHHTTAAINKRPAWRDMHAAARSNTAGSFQARARATYVRGRGAIVLEACNHNGRTDGTATLSAQRSHPQWRTQAGARTQRASPSAGGPATALSAQQWQSTGFHHPIIIYITHRLTHNNINNKNTHNTRACGARRLEREWPCPTSMCPIAQGGCTACS